MTAANFEASIKMVGISEGGFTLHKLDRGNYYGGKLIGTNHGISAPVLADYIGRAPTREEMRNLSKNTANEIFRKQFYNKVKFNDMPSGVDHALVDYAINSGPSRAIKELQRAIDVTADGSIGPITMGAVNALRPSVVVRRLMARRLSFLQRLRSWKTFGRGWGKRVERVHRDALTMIEGEC